MKMCIVTLESATNSPYSQSKYISEGRRDRETAKDHEARCWRERLHANDEGNVIIPPMALKNCLAEAAKFLGMQIPGKGKATYTKHFEAGVMVTTPVDLGVKAEDVKGEWLFVPSDGTRGGGRRVEKCFPKIDKWSGTATFYILDATVTEEVFKKVLTEAGKFIGLGRFRPRNNGYYGRFKPVRFEWLDEESEQAA